MKLYLLNSKSSIGFHFDDLISSNRFDKLELIIAKIKWLWNNEIELMCECRVRSWRTWNCSTFAPTCQSVWSNVNKRRSYSTARNFLSPDHKNNRNDVTRLTRSTSRWYRVASWSDVAHISQEKQKLLIVISCRCYALRTFSSIGAFCCRSIAVETQIQLSLLALATLDCSDLSSYFSW